MPRSRPPIRPRDTAPRRPDDINPPRWLSGIAVALILTLIIGIAVVAAQNLGIFKQTPTPTPIHIEQSAMSAQRREHTAYCKIPDCPYLSGNISEPPYIEIDKGGTLTFTVNIPQAGMYSVCLDGKTNGAGVITTMSVNGKVLTKIQNDAFGSNSPSSCVTDNPVHLQRGSNSIQVTANCETGNCASLFVHGIWLDSKSLDESSTQAAATPPPLPAKPTPTPVPVQLAAAYQGKLTVPGYTSPYGEYPITLDIAKTNTDGSFEGTLYVTYRWWDQDLKFQEHVPVRGLSMPFSNVDQVSQIDSDKVAQLQQTVGDTTGSLLFFTTTGEASGGNICVGCVYYGAIKNGSVQGNAYDRCPQGATCPPWATFKLSPS